MGAFHRFARNRRLCVGLLAGAAFLGASTAGAAYLGSSEFVQPDGQVGPTDTIPVWVRFTLDPSSDPLFLTNDPNGSPPFGVPAANIPVDQFASRFTQPPDDLQITLIRVYTNTGFLCNGTFTASCISGPPYDFNFNTSGPDTINFLPDFSDPNATFELLPGASREYLFGTFVPSAGPVAPGTYQFFGSGLTLNFDATLIGTTFVRDLNGDLVQDVERDANGDPILDEFGDPILLFDDDGNPVYLFTTETIDSAFVPTELGNTPCNGFDPNCTGFFSRTVVPLPAGAWLMLSGLGALAAWARRRV